MPPLAIAGIAAAATIGGAAISSHASSSAARTAANAQTQATDSNNALAREQYASNSANLRPFMRSGTQANSLIDSFIYGPQQGAPQSYAPGPANGGGVAYGGGAGNSGYPTQGGGFGYDQPIGVGGVDGWSPSDRGGYGFDSSYSGAGPVSGGVTTNAPQNALGGWDAFVASPYYQNPLMEGYRALNGGLASSGRLFTGDAMKRAVRYAQDYGAGRQDEFLNLVGGQANRGFGAASALAGVGQNMVNNVTANNNQAADAVGNAALLRAQGTNALVSGVSSGIGSILGALPTSYKKGY